LSRGETAYLDTVYDAEDLARRRQAARQSYAACASRLESVRTFCGFIGYHKSGHSLLATMVNAHPAALIAHELDVLWLLEQGCDREEILAMLLARDDEFAAMGRQWMGYDYAIEVGAPATALTVIGDKKAGQMSARLGRQPGLLDQLSATIGLPVRLIHVVRDPYDNIASHVRVSDGGSVSGAIERYFRTAQIVRDVRGRAGDGVILDVHLDDLIAEPRAELRRVLGFLELDAAEDLLRACEEKVFSEPRRTRAEIEWTDADLREIATGAAEIPWLARYVEPDRAGRRARGGGTAGDFGGAGAGGVALAARIGAHADRLAQGGRAAVLVGLLRAAANDGAAIASVFDSDPADVDPAPTLAAALRYLALSGRAPDLASALDADGPGATERLWPLARTAIADNLDEVRAFVERGNQSNEPGLSAALYGALLLLAERHGMPVRLLELGASAGLNLNADRYRYTVGDDTLGTRGSPLGFRDPWEGGRVQPLADPDAPLRISARAGCDLHPIDSRTDEGRQRLLAYLWADQAGAIARLEQAFAVKPAPPKVAAAPAAGWLSRQLGDRQDGELTVVFSSRLREYMRERDRTRLQSVLAEVGADATVERPLVALELEPAPGTRGWLAFVLRTWPHHERQLLARCRPGGLPVRWELFPARSGE
jgi:hypothetical protein